MLRKLQFLLAVSVASLFLPATAHAYCYGQADPGSTTPGHVCGTVYKLGHNGSNYVVKASSTSYVKICPAGTNSFNCSTTSTGSYVDLYGQPVQAWIFPFYRAGALTTDIFDFYAWGQFDSSNPWGSETKPLRRFAIYRGLTDVQLKMPPRPLEPTPVYPSGNTVPSSYTVRWKSGRDIDRTPYPMTYEVWYKYWPFNGTEPTSWTLSAANLGCHADGSGPDANNECSTYVAGPQPAGNWKWYVVANADVSAATPQFPNTIFSTTSSWVAFTQPE